MRKKVLALICFLVSNVSMSQIFGTYEFNLTTNVTTQSVETEFTDFGGVGTSLTTSLNYLQTSNWAFCNTTSINTDRYLYFYLHTLGCYRFTLDSIKFDVKKSTNAGNNLKWHLRSSLDNFQSDLGNEFVTTTFTTKTVILNQTLFSSLSDIGFKIYLTEISSSTEKFYCENLKIYGSETYYGPLEYYIDNDNDGFGAGEPISSCAPIGVSNNLDCDDNNEYINPNSIWYEDSDGDGAINFNSTDTACISSFEYAVLYTSELLYDCDDSDPNVFEGAFEDMCPDGIDQNCDGLDGDEFMTHCYYFYDYDGDGFGVQGETVYLPCDCGYDEINLSNGYSHSDDDCNDNNSTIYPGAIEIPNNGIDENCDGLAGISENSKSTLKLSPNPGTSSLLISIANFEKGNFTIQILDNQGKIILRDQLNLNQLGTMEINTTEFAKGAYQIVIQNDKQIFRNSWVKI